MNVEVLSYTPDGEKLIAAAAKLCYSDSGIDDLLEGLTPEKTERFLSMLGDLGHASPFEHVSITFGIEGVSRAVLAQITRHRIASFSVQSQRYVNKQSFSYIIPPEIEAIPEARAEFIRAMEEDRAHYIALADILTKRHFDRLVAAGTDEKEARRAASKLAFEDARAVLPNACDTKIVMTMNVRSLYNFFSLRCCNRAQGDIRALATEMLRRCRRTYPLLFSHAGPPCLNGRCPEGKMSCGKAAEVKERFESLQ